MTQPFITVENVTLSYKTLLTLRKQQGYKALDNISFTIKPGETFGIVGRNGCGKSSLLQLLAGVMKPTSGAIIEHSPKGLSKALLTLGFGFNRYLSGRDNAILSAMLQGYSKKDALLFLDEIRDFSELEDFFEKPVLTYSSGMKSKLGFATAMVLDVDLLLIDETLSVGDELFRKKAEKAMKQKLSGDQTVVFVSHNEQQMNRICDRSIWLEKGVIKAAGTPKEVGSEYKKFMTELKKQHKQQIESHG